MVRLESVRVEFDPHVLCIGAFWGIHRAEALCIIHVWICLIPMFPLHIEFIT